MASTCHSSTCTSSALAASVAVAFATDQRNDTCGVGGPFFTAPVQDLHASACLEDLRPGDHFEIQWRKNKDFPYGMYGFLFFPVTTPLQNRLRPGIR